MAESRLNTGVEENPTASDSPRKARRIRASESDALIARFREVLGDESVSSFSRRCLVVEGTLRNILNGALPRTDILVAIADAAGVTVDWLATGRPPKTRAELRDLVAQGTQAAPAPSAAPLINVGALQALIEGTLKVAPEAPVSAQAAHIAKVYKDLLDKGMITAEGIGSGHLNAAA